jgi:5-methylcytosine-specific restriction endonuclease McrA
MQPEYKTLEQKRKFYNSVAWKQKSNDIKRRDNYECVMCKEEGRVTVRDHAVLEVDHIYELEYYPRLALIDENLRTLCKWHHNKRHKRFGNVSKKSKWDDERW